MRAPADSTKPITGTRERSASSSTATTVSAWASPSEPPAKEASCANTATARPSTRPLRAEHAVAGARLLAHPPRQHLGAQQVEEPGSQRPRVARAASAARRVGVRGAETLMLPPDRARCCGRRSRTSWRSRSPLARRQQSSGRASRARSRGRARGRAARAERRRDHAVAQREDRRDRLDRAGGAEQVADRRLGRGDRDRVGVLAERRLERERLGAVVERRRGAVGVDVDDVARGRRRRPRARRAIAAAAPARRLGSGAVMW